MADTRPALLVTHAEVTAPAQAVANHATRLTRRVTSTSTQRRETVADV